MLDTLLAFLPWLVLLVVIIVLIINRQRLGVMVEFWHFAHPQKVVAVAHPDCAGFVSGVHRAGRGAGAVYVCHLLTHAFWPGEFVWTFYKQLLPKYLWGR
jgi:hypothetical protein